MRNSIPRLIVALAIVGISVPIFAHHGFSVEFDGSKCMDLRGTLSGIDWETHTRIFRWMSKLLTEKQCPGTWR